MSYGLYYLIARAATLRDWAEVDAILADARDQLPIAQGRTDAHRQLGVEPKAPAPNPVTMHDLPPGALIVVDIDPYGNRKLRL